MTPTEPRDVQRRKPHVAEDDHSNERWARLLAVVFVLGTAYACWRVFGGGL